MENSNLGNVSNITEYLTTLSDVEVVRAYTTIPPGTNWYYMRGKNSVFGQEIPIPGGSEYPKPVSFLGLRFITASDSSKWYCYGINIPSAYDYFRNAQRFGSTVSCFGYNEVYTISEVKLYPRDYTWSNTNCHLNIIYYPSSPSYLVATMTEDWGNATYSLFSTVEEEDYEI